MALTRGVHACTVRAPGVTEIIKILKGRRMGRVEKVVHGYELFTRHPELGWLHMGPYGWHEVPEGFVKVHEEIAKKSRETEAWPPF